MQSPGLSVKLGLEQGQICYNKQLNLRDADAAMLFGIRH